MDEFFDSVRCVNDETLVQCRTDCDDAVTKDQGPSAGGMWTSTFSTPRSRFGRIGNIVGRTSGITMLTYQHWIHPDIGSHERDILDTILKWPIAAESLWPTSLPMRASHRAWRCPGSSRLSSFGCAGSDLPVGALFLGSGRGAIGNASEEAILKCLPSNDTEPKPKTFQKSVVEHTQLQEYDMVEGSNSSAIGKWESVQLVLSQIPRGGGQSEVSPDLSFSLKKVLSRCSGFLVLEVKGKTRPERSIARCWRTTPRRVPSCR